MSGDDLDQDLLDHLVVEFFDFGQRAVEFLRSTRAPLSGAPADVPRFANMIAYCVREAMDEIRNSLDVDHGAHWATRSQSVVDTKQRLELMLGLPGEDSDAALRQLLARIKMTWRCRIWWFVSALEIQKSVSGQPYLT